MAGSIQVGGKMKPKITKRGSKITVEGKTFDLSDKRGKKVSIYQEKDGSITIDSKLIHENGYQLAELEVPPRVIEMVETGETDADDMPITTPKEVPLKLGTVEVNVFDVPVIKKSKEVKESI